VHDKIPATLITDSTAAALLRLKGASERIAAVVVGADRVAANGDTANKIGTYSLVWIAPSVHSLIADCLQAILARHHGVKFLVAAPRTTIDLGTPSGECIVIEERPGEEMTFIKGPIFEGVNVVPKVETVSIAAKGIDVWNPAFDITPADLIDGIVTEVGVATKASDGRFDLRSLFQLSK